MRSPIMGSSFASSLRATSWKAWNATSRPSSVRTVTIGYAFARPWSSRYSLSRSSSAITWPISLSPFSGFHPSNRRVLLGAAYTEPPRSFGAVRRASLEAYERRSAPASVAIAKSALRHLDEFDSRACETIRADELGALVTALARTHARMAQLVLRYAKMVLRTTRDRGQVVDAAIFTIKPPQHVERVPTALTWAQVEDIASWMPDSLARIVPVAAATGLRQGELLRLQTSDIDLDGATIRVRTGKTASAARVVDLPAVAVSLLREQLLIRPRGTALVFPSATGLELDRNRFMSRYFRPATRRAGLPGATFHHLRHTFISLMASAGVHVSVIASMVGHADGGALLLRKYRHLFPHEQRQAAAAFDRLVRGGVAHGSQAPAAT
jgi:integrase